jgi:hypothetical protein
MVDVQTRIAVANKLNAYENAPRALVERVQQLIPKSEATGDGFAPTGPGGDGDAVFRKLPDEGAEPPAPRQTSEEPLPRAAGLPRSSGGESLGELFLRGTPAERKTLLLRLENEPAKPLPPAGAKAKVGTIDRLEAAAMQRDQSEFARELQQSLDLSGRIARQIATDQFGEPILIIARALGMPPDILLRVLLFLTPSIGESVERVFSLIKLYDEIAQPTAVTILESWRRAARWIPPPKFRPLHAPDPVQRAGRGRDGMPISDSSRDQSAPQPREEGPGRRQDTV